MAMAVQMFLPFSFFSSEKWRQMIGFEAAGDTPYPPLPVKRVKHLLVEMYVATKKVSDVVHHALGSLLDFHSVADGLFFSFPPPLFFYSSDTFFRSIFFFSA